jgi:hypothetical protein
MNVGSAVGSRVGVGALRLLSPLSQAAWHPPASLQPFSARHLVTRASFDDEQQRPSEPAPHASAAPRPQPVASRPLSSRQGRLSSPPSTRRPSSSPHTCEALWATPAPAVPSAAAGDAGLVSTGGPASAAASPAPTSSPAAAATIIAPPAEAGSATQPFTPSRRYSSHIKADAAQLAALAAPPAEYAHGMSEVLDRWAHLRGPLLRQRLWPTNIGASRGGGLLLRRTASGGSAGRVGHAVRPPGTLFGKHAPPSSSAPALRLRLPSLRAPLRSIIKVYSVHSRPNYTLPWQVREGRAISWVSLAIFSHVAYRCVENVLRLKNHPPEQSALQAAT